MIERELTWLAKEIPAGLSDCKQREIHDLYVPCEAGHSTLRIRKNGTKYEITRKEPAEDDPSEQRETTIPITKQEFTSLKKAGLLEVRKIRHFYPYQERMLEIDVFCDELEGLVLVEAEFETSKEKASYPMPAFCLSDVTETDTLAGGMLCGRSYAEIKEYLDDRGYAPLSLDTKD